MNIFLAGCWDQQPLVDKTIVNGISFDLTDEGKIHATVRDLILKSTGGGQFEVVDELVHAERPSLAGLSIDVNSKTAGQVDYSQANILLIGDELAKKGIQQVLDPFYRGKNSSITSKVVITNGKAEEIISSEIKKSPIAFYILKLMESAVSETLIPDENVFTVWTKILSPGKDIIVPYVKLEESKIVIDGVALFNGNKFSGTTLSKEQSSLLLLLLDDLNKTNTMSPILNQDSKEQYISFATRKLKRNMEIKVDEKSGNINAKIDLNIQVEVNTIQQDLRDNLKIKKLNQEISKELTKQAKEVIDLLLKANCDVFGIGMEISNTHPDLWKKMNWDEEYKNVQIEPKVNVKIIKTGNLF